jgi:hypothetical protein
MEEYKKNLSESLDFIRQIEYFVTLALTKWSKHVL